MAIVHTVCCGNNIFNLHSICWRFQQHISSHKYDCVCSPYMGIRIFCFVEEKNPLNFTRTAEKHNSYLLVYINELFIFRNLNKTISIS